MQPHQQRVVEECQDLDQKLSKLILFFDSDAYRKLDMDEKIRLNRQACIMIDYLKILNDRINHFPTE